MSNPDSNPTPQQPEQKSQWVSLPAIEEIPVGGHTTTRIGENVVDHEVYGSQGDLIGQKRTDKEGNQLRAEGEWVTLPALGEPTPGSHETTQSLVHRLGSIIKSKSPRQK